VVRCRLPAFLLLVLAAAVASAKDVDRSKIPPTQLQEGVLLKSCDAIGKGAANAVFSVDVPCIEASVSLLHVSSPHTLRFLYYDPDGNLYATTRPDWSFGPPAEKKEYHRTARITHRLHVQGEEAAFHVGGWKVAVWLDELHLAETRFQLERPQLPLEQNLSEAKSLYREGNYEKAMERLNTVINMVQHKGLVAEAAWWLALSEQAAGRDQDVDATLVTLLKADPTFDVTPAAAKEAGGDAVRSRLEDVRKRELLDLYVKTVDVPNVELSPPEDAPVLGKRWPLWEKLLIYGGIPVAAAATTVLLVGGGQTTVTGPPTVMLRVDPAAVRDRTYGLLCVGQIPLRVTITGGAPPFEAIFTAAKLPASLADVRVQGHSLSTTDLVVLKQSIPNTGDTTVRYPAIEMSPFNIVEMRFTVVVKDSMAKVSFDTIVTGQPLPASVLQDSRVVQQLSGGGMITGCAQN
jgi:hypothetical protein